MRVDHTLTPDPSPTRRGEIQNCIKRIGAEQAAAGGAGDGGFSRRGDTAEVPVIRPVAADRFQIRMMTLDTLPEHARRGGDDLRRASACIPAAGKLGERAPGGAVIAVRMKTFENDEAAVDSWFQ